MLTFEDVVNAPVAKLKQAADDWSEMATKLKTLATDAREGMKAKTDKAQWQGVNSDVTRPFVAKTAKEFEDAEAQAKGIQLLLADAHTSFLAARDALVRIRDEEGPAAGVHVDAKGKVTPRHDLEKDVTARHDPDQAGYAEAVRKQKAAVVSWQARIDRLVEDCADADDSLRRALAANVKDEHDFTAPTYKSLDEEQVARAAELLKKVSGEGGTARNVAELKELEDLLDDNRNDPEFATGFYRWVGPAATLDAYAEMSLNSTSLGPAGKDRVDMVRNIQSDMGAMLGLATQKSTPNHLDAVWTSELMRSGRKQLDVQGVGFSQIYGYQALSGLLRDGTYDKDFLVSVGRDMVAMDREKPGVWSESLPRSMDQRINLDETGGKGFNPLTGLMEAMANNPEASAAFFDEQLRSDTNKDGIVTLADEELTGKDAKSVVDHMLDKKPADDYYDTVSGGEQHPGQAATGNALEAAVTGRVPGDENAKPVEHTKTMASVMEKVVEKIGNAPELVTDEGPLGGLSPNFGNMAAEYMPDLQAAAENGADQAMPFGEMAKFKKDEMAFFLGAVGQDPDAYGAITNAQQAYTTMLVADVFQHPERHGDPGDALRNAVHPGGEIAGIMTEARAQAVHEAKAHEAEEYNKGTEENAKWTNRIIDMVGGKYIEMIPVGGDVITWIKEDVTESAVESAQQDKSEEARRETGRDYTASEDAAKTAAAAAVDAAARGTGLTPEQIEEYRGVASVEAGTAHSVGRDLISSTKG
ncbi:DUF6571 family protein [Streptomyces hydrogenans]|uniref:DUF6571 domain-containing protein n=1 Tax=Streptomyces hydrogenans TaxID=1873719 RepID=A0ABQ3P3N7_9ACTN|nr:DUF6571 family protein [Streptomyces hydrogenans]GHE25577.1 hypothetical protein GCM10018784_74370 [Streptomyces hydrogenans]GHI19635.1 hypothetical protein Shyd_10060 [Streptomyces hydrogenans]